VVGPNLVSTMGDVADGLAIPRLAGPFLLAAVAYGTAGAVLLARLRPDPLLLARALDAARPPAGADVAPAVGSEIAPDISRGVGSGEGRAGDGGSDGHAGRDGHGTDADHLLARGISPGVAVGASVMVVTQLVMVGIMTMTPIHMRDHGHGVGATGVVIAAHIGAMYLPSPVSGLLVDRVGRTALAGAGGAVLLAAGLMASLSPPASVPGLAVALGLLGLGWNLGLVAGTAIITDAVPLATRARTQGAVDLCIALAGAGGGLGSGLVVANASYAVLALTGGVVSVAIIPIVAISARRTGRSATDSPAVEPGTTRAAR
jgi:hypothetical protein